MKIEQLLKESELFKGISDIYRNQIFKKSRVFFIKENEMIFLEGEEGEFFYLLAEGTVKLYKSGIDGREVIVKLVNPGEIFAEVIIFESSYYPVSSVAVSDSRVLAIGKNTFNDLLNNSEFRNEFISFIMQKQRYLTQRILYLTAFDVEERFFRFLFDSYGEKYSYEISLAKKDLASAIGTIPETYSRLMQRLSKREIIKWEGNILNIKDGFWDDFF